jgi:hypothetical protein
MKSELSKNGRYWKLEWPTSLFDTIDPTTASDREIAEFVADHFVMSQFYTEKHWQDDYMPFVHSLVRTGPNHYRTPTREVCNKPETSKRPKYGGPGSDYDQWQKDSARHKKQERAWVVDMLLAGFGIAQLVCYPEQDYEPTINLHYESLQDARRSIESRQAAEWRDYVKDATAAGDPIYHYGEIPADILFEGEE